MIKCLIYGEDISRFRYVKLKAKRQKHKMTAPVFYANINQNWSWTVEKSYFGEITIET